MLGLYLSIINDSKRLWGICQNKIFSIIVVILVASNELACQTMIKNISNKSSELFLAIAISAIITCIYCCVLLFVPSKNNLKTINNVTEEKFEDYLSQ